MNPIVKKESYKLFDEIAKTYDFLNHFLSFGLDIYWRKKILKYLPHQQELWVLDLATGTGDVPIVLCQHPKVKKVKGIDKSKEMIALGKIKIDKKNLNPKISLELGDGVDIPFPDNSFNVVTLSFGIRNFPDPQKSLANILRVLKPGGRVLIMEFAIPQNIIIRKIYFLYFRHILPRIGNVWSGHGNAYSYLNQTVENFPHGESFQKWMDVCGFKETSFKHLTLGVVNLYIGEKGKC